MKLLTPFEAAIEMYQWNPCPIAYKNFIHKELYEIACKAANSLRSIDHEEFVATALIQFFEKLKGIDFLSIKNLRGFLYRLFLNRMKDLLRAKQRRMNRFPYIDEITLEEDENDLSREAEILCFA